MKKDDIESRKKLHSKFAARMEFNGGEPGSLASDYLFSLNLPGNENLGSTEWAYIGPGKKRGLIYDVIAAPVHNPKGEVVTYWMLYMDKNEPANLQDAAVMLPEVGSVLGGAIRLTKAAELMGIAAGVENALAVTKIYGVPCWAAPSNDMFGMFRPPDGVKQLIIYSDNHQDCVRQQEAYKLAERLHKNTEIITVICFPMVGDSYINLVVTDERDKAAFYH